MKGIGVFVSGFGKMPMKQSPNNGRYHAAVLRILFIDWGRCPHKPYKYRSFKFASFRAFCVFPSGSISLNTRIIGTELRNVWYFTHTCCSKLFTSFNSGDTLFSETMSRKTLDTLFVSDSPNSQYFPCHNWRRRRKSSRRPENESSSDSFCWRFFASS